MTQILKPFQRPCWTAALTLMVLIGTGCNAGSSGVNAHDDTDGIAVLAGMDFVESVEMTVVNPGSAKDEQLILEVRMDERADVRYPDAFNILGVRNDGSIARMEDSGTGADAVAGDGIYSAHVDRSCLEDGSLPEFAGKDFIKFTLTCEVDFISPGDECEGEGICPESDSRSFFWGLIEYDVDVVTCWCFQGCSADVEFSLGKSDQPSNPTVIL